jgi:hypothetical protein
MTNLEDFQLKETKVLLSLEYDSLLTNIAKKARMSKTAYITKLVESHLDGKKL